MKKIISLSLLTVVLFSSVLNVHAISLEDLITKVNNTQNNTTPSTNLPFVKINETVSIDSEITMTLYLDNIDYDNFTFKLYSNNSLEEVKTNDIDLTNYNNEEISFDYCINCSSLKTIVLNYKLPADVEVGDNITFNIQLINKANTEEMRTHRATVLVTESIKKEEEEKKDEDKEKSDKQKSSFSKINTVTYSGGGVSSAPTSGASIKYKGSTNNYLKNITVKEYELNKPFTKERLTYFVTVPNNVTSLNISTSKENSNASVNISGNSNFSVGVNKVLITVTAQDGRIKNYRIYVTRLDSDTNEK